MDIRIDPLRPAAARSADRGARTEEAPATTADGAPAAAAEPPQVMSREALDQFMVLLSTGKASSRVVEAAAKGAGNGSVVNREA